MLHFKVHCVVLSSNRRLLDRHDALHFVNLKHLLKSYAVSIPSTRTSLPLPLLTSNRSSLYAIVVGSGLHGALVSLIYQQQQQRSVNSTVNYSQCPHDDCLKRSQLPTDRLTSLLAAQRPASRCRCLAWSPSHIRTAWWRYYSAAAANALRRMTVSTHVASDVTGCHTTNSQSTMHALLRSFHDARLILILILTLLLSPVNRKTLKTPQD